MKKHLLFALSLLTLVFALQVEANAGVGVLDDETYKEQAGVLDFGRGLDVTDSGTTKRVDLDGSDIFFGAKRNTIIIDDPTDTTGAVTALRTGYTFVLAPRGQSVDGVGYTLELPAAAEGLEYTFTTDTGTALSVKTNGSDIFKVGGGAKRLTGPNSSGSVLRVVGGSGVWYIEQMNAPELGGPVVWTLAQS